MTPTHDFQPGEIIELIAGSLGPQMPLGTRVTVTSHLPNVSDSCVCYELSKDKFTWRPANYFRRVGPIKTETIVKKTLVDGVYGRLNVNKTHASEPTISLRFVDRNGKIIANEFGAGLDVFELRQMSETILELANFLEKST